MLKKKLSDTSSSTHVRTVIENLAKWQLAASNFLLIRQQLLESFLSFIPRSYQKYEKPSDAGLKKKPGNLPKADVSVDNVRGDIDHSSSDSDATASVVTPLKVKKQKNGKTKSDHREIVNKSKVPTVDIFNLNRVTSKIYRLVYKSDKSSFPASVK